MIGIKVDTKAYKQAGIIKKQNNPCVEETLLTHYNTLSQTNKKLVKSFFEETIQPLNGFKGMILEDAIQQYLFELRADVGSSRVDLQACKLEYSIVSPK